MITPVRPLTRSLCSRSGGRVASRVARLAMKIRVAHGARRHEVTISGSATVAELKDKLQPLTGVPAQLQDLQIMGDSLCDEASLAELQAMAASAPPDAKPLDLGGERG